MGEGAEVRAASNRGQCARRNGLRIPAVLSLLGALSLSTLTASSATAASDDNADTIPQTKLAPDPTFAQAFTAYRTPARPDLNVPVTAVDLDSFEPPLEQTEILRSLGTGVASYYGRRFHGRRTANGERFNMRAMTAAHRTLPFGSLVRVTNPRNGRSVTVRINDRGPFIRGRTIDLSRAAAERIGMIARGHARVELELVK